MREPKTLLLDDGSFNDLLSGRITATIRIGDRTFEEDEIITLKASRNNYLPVKVRVTGLAYPLAIDLPHSDAMAAGYRSVSDALATLKVNFYPTMKLSTPLTVIYFERV